MINTILRKLLMQDVFAPFMFLIFPKKVYDNIKSRDRWEIAPLIVVILVLLIKVLYGNLWSSQPLIDQLKLFYLFSILIIFIVTIIWFAISTVLYLSILLVKSNNLIPYKKTFSIVSYCGIIILLGEITNFLLNKANIISPILYALPNRFPIGLDIITLFYSQCPTPLAIFLHSINPFSIWYFISIAIGISIVADINGIARSINCAIYFMKFCLINCGFRMVLSIPLNYHNAIQP